MVEYEMTIGLMVATGCTSHTAKTCVAAAEGSIARATQLWLAKNVSHEAKQGEPTMLPQEVATMSAVFDAIIGRARQSKSSPPIPSRRIQPDVTLREDLEAAAALRSGVVTVAIRLFSDGFIVALVDGPGVDAGGYDLRRSRFQFLRRYSEHLHFLRDIQEGKVPLELRQIADIEVQVIVEDYLPQPSAALGLTPMTTSGYC